MSIGATPKEFANLIQTFKKIFEAKQSAALEQQSHLNAGLLKLSEAAKVVDVLSRDAEEKKILLADKQEQANQALAEITKSMEMASDQRREMKTSRGKAW